MAGTRFQVKSYGANIVSRKLHGIGRTAEDLRPAWPAVARRAAAGYARSFSRQGPGWSQLKPSTVRTRIAEGYAPGPILRASGSYREAFTNPARLVLIPDNHELQIGVDDERAGWHQSGTSKMSSRQVKLSFGDRMLIVQEIDKTLMDGYVYG